MTKPLREYDDSRGRVRIKSNIHIDLAVDALEMADHVDHIILFSGDGDLRRLVEAIQRRGVRVTIVSTLKSSPPMVSGELRRQADGFIEIMDLVPDIKRTAQLQDAVVTPDVNHVENVRETAAPRLDGPR